MSEILSFKPPISGIYILDQSGIPLFARYYEERGEMTDSTLLGGFFSAIEIFVKTSLHGLLTDIGMTNRRFFFDRSNEGYIIVLVSQKSDLTEIESNLLEIINSLLDTINNCLNVLHQISVKQLMKMDFLIENLGSSVDSFLLETSFNEIDFDELDNENIYSNIENGYSIDPDKLEEIINFIKTNQS